MVIVAIAFWGGARRGLADVRLLMSINTHYIVGSMALYEYSLAAFASSVPRGMPDQVSGE